MKILVTGAHFTPALAVIEELKKTYNADILYVGRNTTMEGDNTLSVESQILPKLGVKFISLTTGRLQRDFSLYTIISLLKIPFGLTQSFIIILFYKPDVILSFGGYVAVPVVFVGWLFSIPIIIHEQTLVSGLANKISSFFADKIAISFKENTNYKSNKSILTGNPIRQSILSSRGLRLNPRNELKTVLVTGGNQGSHIINQTIESSLDELTKIAKIIHVTGQNKFADYERLEKKQNEKYIVKKWIGEEWGGVVSKVDLVISRAGINTLSELAFLGKPALVVPIPYLYADEQNENAKYFESLGLVKIIPQAKLSKELLLKNIKLMLNDLRSIRQRAKEAKKVIIPDAAKRLALETVLLCRQK